MALVCDYCGDVTESQERVSVAFGHNQEIALKGATAQEWFYYCDGECADTVKAMLENLRLYAMHGEGSGLAWQLVEQELAPLPDEDPAARPKPVAAKAPEPEPSEDVDRDEEREREIRTRSRRSLTWWLQRKVAIPVTELGARQETGTPVADVLGHTQKAKGNLHNAGIATLEDAAALTEVEFAGLPGVGARIVEIVREALEKHDLAFAPGPTSDQLGALLRDERIRAGLEVDELAGVVAAGLGAPTSEGDGYSSNAVRTGEAAIRNCESGAKSLAPPVLDALGEALKTSRPELLAKAMEVTAA